MGIEELVIIAQLTPERNLDIPCRAVAREYRGSHLFGLGRRISVSACRRQKRGFIRETRTDFLRDPPGLAEDSSARSSE